MIKRVLIESLVIFSLLLICVLYGSVSIREAQHASQSMTPTQQIVIPEPESSTDDAPALSPADSPDEPEEIGRAGDSISEKISAFFLSGVHFIASIVEHIIHVFL
ncbi:hypothetical protein ABNN70_12975 [Sporolactobacillus sp. Y61]|uniref:Uncharacterized protein n=1 Tax=Sporolactobacillus sp. Y61 TaxID=3160863 RepID=A0AAU8IEX5_9BACL